MAKELSVDACIIQRAVKWSNDRKHFIPEIDVLSLKFSIEKVVCIFVLQHKAGSRKC